MGIIRTMRSLETMGIIAVGILILALVLPMPMPSAKSACATPAIPSSAPGADSGAGTRCSSILHILHTAMSPSGNCLPCGAATPAAQPFLPTEALEEGLPPEGLRSPLGPLSLPWRPPA